MGLLNFLQRLTKIAGIQELTLTTNGVLTAPYITDLVSIGIQSVNLSLDTLDRERFLKITRRDELPAVLNTLDKLLEASIHTKINAVVMDGQNTQALIPLAALTRSLPIDVRFIEEMPFNGEGNHDPNLTWTYSRIVNELRAHFPTLSKQSNSPFSTATTYQILGHLGTIGVSARHFVAPATVFG